MRHRLQKKKKKILRRQKKRTNRSLHIFAIGLLLLLGASILYQTNSTSKQAVLAAKDSLQMGWFTFKEIHDANKPKPKAKKKAAPKKSPARNFSTPRNSPRSVPGAHPIPVQQPGTSASTTAPTTCNHDNGLYASGKTTQWGTTCNCQYYLVTCEPAGQTVSMDTNTETAVLAAKNKKGGGGKKNNNNNGGGNNNKGGKHGGKNSRNNNNGGGNNNGKNKPNNALKCTKAVQGSLVSGMTCKEITSWCNSPNLVNGPGVYCLGKPVIYLYPQKTTKVDVNVTFDYGDVYISNPMYNTGFHGWENVTASPDGTLSYQGNTYHELYYETATKNVIPEKKGIIISSANLKEQLSDLTYKLGLKENEQQEFLSYWIPKLEALNLPYVLVSLVGPAEKDHVDSVHISPKPDTFIEFLLYFRPLEYPIALEPLSLPQTPPKRVGFTAVEWGGTIDFN